MNRSSGEYFLFGSSANHRRQIFLSKDCFAKTKLGKELHAEEKRNNRKSAVYFLKIAFLISCVCLTTGGPSSTWTSLTEKFPPTCPTDGVLWLLLRLAQTFIILPSLVGGKGPGEESLTCWWPWRRWGSRKPLPRRAM